MKTEWHISEEGIRAFGIKTKFGRNLLQSLADGIQSQELARRAGVSYSLMRGHLLHIRGELGAKNTLHAIAIAMRKGIIK